jgi:hypothetical protein
MDDLKLETREGILDSAEEPGNQDDGLRTVGPDVSYDGVQVRRSEEATDVTAELGLKNDVPKDMSGGCCMSIERYEGDARKTEVS